MNKETDELLVEVMSDDDVRTFFSCINGAKRIFDTLKASNNNDDMEDDDEVDKVTIQLTDEDFDDEYDNNSEDKDDNTHIPIYLRCSHSPNDNETYDINFWLNGERFDLKYNIISDEWLSSNEEYIGNEDEMLDIIEKYAIPKRDEMVVKDFLDCVDDCRKVANSVYSLLGTFREVYGDIDKVVHHKFAEMLLAMERSSYSHND